MAYKSGGDDDGSNRTGGGDGRKRGVRGGKGKKKSSTVGTGSSGYTLRAVQQRRNDYRTEWRPIRTFYVKRTASVINEAGSFPTTAATRHTSDRWLTSRRRAGPLTPIDCSWS